MTLGWSTDFIVVHGDGPALGELHRVDAARARWVVIERMNGLLRYVFSRDEFFTRLRLTRIPYDPASTATLVGLLDLHETQASTGVPEGQPPAPPDLSWRPDERAPSVLRYVEFAPAGGRVLAVGGADVAKPRRTRSMSPSYSVPDAASYSYRPRSGPSSGSPPGPTAVPPAPAVPTAEDEGTTPIRFPSIECEGSVRSGLPITLRVDLLREESPSTVGGLSLAAQPADWRQIELSVTLQSPLIDFEGPGLLSIRRNDSTKPARVAGRVHDSVAVGTAIDVKARFFLGTRHCGSAQCALVVAGQADAHPPPVASMPSQGTVQVDTAAQAPDLTVHITLFERDRAGRLHWLMKTPWFDKLPAKLTGESDLGRDPGAEAAMLFKQFANLKRGKHREAIEGFGEELWSRAPREFHDAYWALHDHYQRPLTIQFVSDDPHLPWELMSPSRPGESHGPLALRHAVARWIGDLQGLMSNRLKAGKLVVVAPRYASASTALSLAEASAEGLVQSLGAERIGGTRDALLGLLEQPPDDAVALLYFTGHGAFNADAANASLIKLEGNDNLSAREIARQKVRLGERHGTVVFFNACEVGATANALGSVGGWAEAFLSRNFRAFIAPLWAIDEEDAAQVTQELMTRIVRERVPVGAALRDLRAKHGDVSPTFFSYLLYGDVTARLDAAA